MSRSSFNGIIKEFKHSLRGFGRTEVLVLGDSHARILQASRRAVAGYYFRTVSVGGATVSGINNPNSVTQAMPIFKDALSRYKGTYCVLFLGEVDTGFVIWYRADKRDLSVDEVFEQTITNYSNFIKSIPDHIKVICVSAPLPTIKDGQDWGEVANQRRAVTASRKDRTQLTQKLNERMADLATKEGFYHINLDAHSLGADGILREDLLNEDPHDNHYEVSAYQDMLLPRLEKILKEI